MNIERLEELKTNLMFEKAVSDEATRLDKDSETNRTVHQNCNDLISLINAEIASQSVTSEEVQEAIEYFEDILPYMAGAPSEPKYRLAITALQAYQPWIPCSERMPTEDDADENGHILAYSEGLQRSTICLWYHIIGDNVTTHWRENVEPPKGE